MNPLNIGLSLENAKINKSSLQTRTSLGRMRNPQNWTYASVQAPQLINRGYTGHEMLPEFDLINMNGRCYDPVVGRFLSTDNFVQDPFSSQCYNRYSYCLNNPLKYSDPSGELTWTDVIAGVSLVAGVVLTATGISAPVGAPLISAGFAHFAYTSSTLSSNTDMTWNEASNYAGFNLSISFNIGKVHNQKQLPVDNANISESNNNMISSSPNDYNTYSGNFQLNIEMPSYGKSYYGQNSDNSLLISKLYEAFEQERQRNINNAEGYYDPYFTEQSTILVDFNGIHSFQKSKHSFHFPQREFWHYNVRLNINNHTLSANIMIMPTANYDRNIVRYVEYPYKQPIGCYNSGGKSSLGYGLYFMNSTNAWAIVTVLFNNKSDYEILYKYLIGGN